MEKNVKKIKNRCTACRSCEQVCPQDAIEMKENTEGFLYPIINMDKCNNCGLCLNRCHVELKDVKEYKKEIFGLKPINKEIAKKSTSGGVAWVISEFILDNKGVVFGSAYDEEFNVHHIQILK